jgi:hypothetical protein
VHLAVRRGGDDEQVSLREKNNELAFAWQALSSVSHRDDNAAARRQRPWRRPTATHSSDVMPKPVPLQRAGAADVRATTVRLGT